MVGSPPACGSRTHKLVGEPIKWHLVEPEEEGAGCIGAGIRNVRRTRGLGRL